MGDTASAWRSQSLTPCSTPIVGPSFLPSLSLHPIRAWHRRRELWKHHTTLPLPWLFTGEIKKFSRTDAWTPGATLGGSVTVIVIDRCRESSLESLCQPQTNEGLQPSVRPAGRSQLEGSPGVGPAQRDAPAHRLCVCACAHACVCVLGGTNSGIFSLLLFKCGVGNSSGGQMCWLVWRPSPPQTPVSLVLGLTLAHKDAMGSPLPL